MVILRLVVDVVGFGVVVVVRVVVVVGFCPVSMMDCGFSDGDGKFERSWVVGRSRWNCVRRYLFAGDSWRKCEAEIDEAAMEPRW